MRLFAILGAIWLVVVITKLGNPVILDHMIEPPGSLLEFIYQSWPLNWGFVSVGLLIGAALVTGSIRVSKPNWILLLPLGWLSWQYLSGAFSIDSRLTGVTLAHFTACCACFYLGLWGFSRMPSAKSLWIGITAALCVALWMGFGQHFGGLEATRQYVYENVDVASLPLEYRKRLASDRIFSCFLYPNTFAGAILLYLPIASTHIWVSTGRFDPKTRLVLVGLAGFAGVLCLLWTGSKSGWLIGLAMLLVSIVNLPIPRRIKQTVGVILLAVGLSLFAVRYAEYFERGATSVGARFDYWQAAIKSIREHPLFGSGPGTFGIVYARIKRPDSEMTRLVHNDYLQQGTDSGLVGVLTYGTFWCLSLILLYRERLSSIGYSAAWIGLFGLFLQSFVEFGLYIPAVAWPAFLVLGWLWGSRPTGIRVDMNEGLA